jgi:hypothetical protein
VTSGADNVIIGYNADVGTNTFGQSIIIGSGAVNTASNQAVLGSSTAKATDVFFGGGVQMTTPTLYTIRGTGALAGTDTNLPGANIGVAAGVGTGTAGTTAGTGASIVVQYPLITTTGTAAQALSTTTLAYVGGPIYVATADGVLTASVATTGTVVGTGLGTLTVEAGLIRPGRKIRVTARGKITQSAAGPTLTVTTKLGATVIGTAIIPANAAGVTAGLIEISANLTCRTAGATGTVYGSGMITTQLAIAALTNITQTMDNGAVTVDCTASQVIDVFGTWSAGTAGNAVTITDVTVEVLF